MDYKKAYYYLFNEITDLIGSLQTIQQNAEDICTAYSDTPPTTLPTISKRTIAILNKTQD